MARGMNLLASLQGYWKRLWRKQTLGKLCYVESMQAIPDRLGRLGYIVGTVKPKWVIMSCPCGCGERIDVNLMQSRHPHWKLQVQNGAISLRP